MKVICTLCNRSLTCERAVDVVEYADFGPYKLWRADVYKCPGCDVTVVTAFGERAYAEHHEAKFDEILARIRASGETIYYF